MSTKILKWGRKSATIESVQRSFFGKRQANMEPKETVQTLMNAIQAGDFEKAHSLINPNDFFCGPSLAITGMVLACPWMEIGKSLRAAFPDLDYQFKIESVDENIVRFSTQFKGTHSNNLDLTAMKMGIFPATHISIATVREYGMATVRHGRIISWAMESVKCTNLFTLLEQLGINSQPIHDN